MKPMPKSAPGILSAGSVAKQGYEYVIDTCQRSVLFGDIIRKRGNNYLHHIKMGKPPILAFDYQMIVDGRTLQRPVNHNLIKICSWLLR